MEFLRCLSWICFIWLQLMASSVSSSAPEFVTSCAPAHCPAAVKFAFETGWSYIYTYESNVLSSVSGTSQDFSSIFIESQVEIHVLQECEFQLKLRQVDLRSRDVDDPAPKAFASGHTEFKRALEEHTLRFSFSDGVVGSVCGHPKEEVWVLNVKRAILSAFQNTAKSLWKSTSTLERDVQGDCPTHYQVDYSWTLVTVTKTKDLEHCNQRHVFISRIQSTLYTSPTGGFVSPVLNSSYECQQTIEDGIIQRVSCDERHLLRAFSNGGAGALTMTKQTLVLMDHVRRPAIGLLTKDSGNVAVIKTTLLFDHDYKDARINSDSMTEAEAALSELCVQSRDDVTVDTPRLFWRFQSKLRLLNYQELTKVFANVDHICSFTSRGQKIFRDALPLVRTVAAVTLIKDLILDNSVSEPEVNSWVTSLAYHPHPTRDILKAVLPLLTLTTPSPRTLLSVSALVHSFCHRTKVVECDTTEEVQTILRLVEDRLGTSCATVTPEDIQRMVTALKAVGNMGRWNASFSALERCSGRSKNPTVVRLAAIQAYRRFGCHVNRRHLMEMFANDHEDVEVRIAAYLGAMVCPSSESINEIRLVLKDEKVNQVNSFVWSHLGSVQKSVDPEGRHVSAILNDVLLHDKYTTDVRKYSRAVEMSAFSEILNAGAHIESHIIYSPSFFLPRSIMLNFTVDLFGHAVNLFEIEIRAQGFEHIAERIFRPEPYDDAPNLRTSSPNKRINELTAMVQSSNQLLKNGPEAALALKIFGQEVWHSEVSGSGVHDTVRRLTGLSWMDLLDRLSMDNSVEIMKDLVLLDAVYEVPTLAGLPMSLALNATTSIYLKMGGHMDIRELATGACDIEGQIRPSGSVAMSASMMVDAYVGRSGVKLDASLSTSSSLDGRVKLTSQGNVKVHLNLPRDHMDFIQARSDLLLTHWGQDRALRIPSYDGSANVRHCSTSLTSHPLGMEFCVQLKYANASLQSQLPYFPLTGPFHLGFWAQKTDSQLSSYHIEYFWDMNHVSEASSSATDDTQTVLLSFRTPRSVVDREWTAEYTLKKMDKSVLVRFLTPYKKIIAKGRYFDEPSRMGLLSTVDVDGEEAFSFQSDLVMDVKGDYNHYQPKVLVRVPTHTVLSLEGLIQHNPGRHLSVDLSLEQFTLKPIVFRGEISSMENINNSRYEASLNSPVLDFTLKGFLNTIDGGLSSKTNLEYQLIDEKPETVDLTMKVRYFSPPSRSLTAMSATLDLHTSAAPHYNSLVTWEYQSADGHLENTLTVERTINRQKTQVFRFQEIVTYNGTLEHNKLVGKFELIVPTKDMFVVLLLDHQNNAQMLHTKINLRRSANKKYGFEVRLVDESTYAWKTSGQLKLQLDDAVSGVSLLVSEQRRSDGPPHYVLQAECYGRLFGDANVSLNYTNQSQRLMFSHRLRLGIAGVAFRLNGSADLLLTDSRGVLVIDANLNDDVYRVNGDYTRLKQMEHEMSMSFHSTENAYSARFLIGTGLEKTVKFDLRSANRRQLEGEASLLLAHDVKSSTLNVAWDPERDPSRMFNFSIRQERQPEVTNTKFDLVYLLHVAHIFMNHRQMGAFQSGLFEQATHFAVEFEGVKNMGGDLGLFYETMKNGRELRGFLDILTPLSVLESLVLNASHADDDRSWKSHGSVLVNGGSPLSLASSGKSWHSGNQWHAEASANMDTPFVGYDSISMTLTRDIASRESRTKAKLQWTSTVNAIEWNSVAIRPGATYDFMMATVNVTTPFLEYKSVGVSAQHSLASGRLDSHLHWSHNSEDVFRVAVNGDAGIRGHYYEVMGILSVITPLDGFDKLSVDVTHSHDGYGLRTDIVCHVPSRGPLAIKVEGSRHTRDRVSSVEFGIDVSSSGTFQLGLGTRYQKRDSDVQFYLRSRWNDLVANVSMEAFYNAVTDLGLDASVKTSVRDLDSTSVSLRNNIRNRHVESWIQAHLGAAKVGVAVNARWDFSSVSPQLNGRLQVDSPFALFHHMTLNLAHGCTEINQCSTVGSHYPTRLRSAWNNMEATVEHTLSVRGRFNFEDALYLSLPIDNWAAINITFNQSLNNGRMISSLRVLQMKSNLVTVDVDSNFTSSSGKSRRTFFIHVLCSSDLVEPKQVEMVINHSDDGIEYYPVVSWKTPNLESAIVVTGYMKSLSGSKILRMTAKTPIPDYNELSMSAMYLLHDTQIKYAVSGKWHNVSRFQVEGEMVIDLMAPRFKLSTLTPFPGYRVFKLDGSYNVWLKRKQALAIVVKEDWSIRLVGSGDFESDFVDSLLTMETSNPYTDHLVINLNATVLWKPQMRSIKTVLSWADDNVAAVSIGFQPLDSGSKGMVLTASMQTHLDSVTDLSSANLRIILHHNDDHHVQTDVAVGWNDVNSVNMGLSLYQVAEVPINWTVTVKSSVPSIPPLHVAVLVQKNATGHLIATEFKIFAKGGSAVWELNHSAVGNGQTQLSVQLETSFATFSKGSFDGTFRNNGKGDYRVTNVLSVPIGNFSIAGTLKSAQEQMAKGTVEVSSPLLMQSIKGDVEFQRTINGFDLSLKLNKPIVPLWELTTANMQYQRTGSRHVMQCAVGISSGHHELCGELSGTLSNLHLYSSLTSPLLMNKHNKLEMDATFRVGETLRTSIWVLDGWERHTFDLTARDFNIDDEVEFRLVADSSLLSSSCLDGSHVLNISANMTHTNVVLHGSVNVSLPCGRHYTSDGHYEKDSNNGVVLLFLDVSTPMDGFSRFRIDARHLGKEWDNAAVSLGLITPIEGYEKFTTSFRTSHVLGTYFDLVVFIDTPFRGYENISLDETLLYSLDFTGFSSATNLTFDGAVLGFGARYNKSSGESNSTLDIGLNGHWRRHNPYVEILVADSSKPILGQMNFKCVGEDTTRRCFLDFTSLGLPWETSGAWNYSGWRHFNGKFIIDTPIKAFERLGIQASNNFTYGTGILNGHCGLQWSLDKIAVVHYGGSVTNSRSTKVDGTFNMSAPFELCHQMDGHVAAVRGAHGIVGSATLNVNTKTFLDGTLEWITDENNVWKNQTAVLDVDNLWRPFGVSALVSRRNEFWALDTTLNWNLTHRDSTNSAALLLEVSSRRSSWRETHVRLRHPRHQADVRTIYSKTKFNLTHSTTLLWGATQFPLISYKVWRNSHQTGTEKNAGFRWSHPGRTLQLLLDSSHPSHHSSRTNVDLWWDIDNHPNKHVHLDIHLEDSKEVPKKSGRGLKVVLKSPSLRENVELVANVSYGSGENLFDAFLDLYYTPIVGDRFGANVSLTSNGGYVFHTSLQHGNSDLASGFTAKMLRGPQDALLSGHVYHISTTYPPRYEEVDVSVGADFISRTVKIKFYDSSNDTHVVLGVSNEHLNNYTLFVASDGIGVHRLVYHPDDPRVEVNITLENGELLSLRSGLNSPVVGSVIVTRIKEDGVNKSEDASFVLSLNNSRLLTFFGRWKQETTEHIQGLVGSCVDDTRNELSSVLWRLWTIFYDEPVVKFQLVLQSLTKELQPLTDEATTEITAVMSEAGMAKVFLASIYKNNDFLMKDIVVFFGKWSDYASDWRDALESLPFAWSPSSFSEWVGRVLQQLRDVADSFWNSWNSWLSRKFRENMENMSQSLYSLINVRGQLESSIYNAFDYLSTAWSGVSLRSSALSFHFEHFSNVGDQLKRIWLTVSSWLRDASTWIKGKVEQICLWVMSSEAYIFVHDYFIWTVVAIRDFVTVHAYEYLDGFLTKMKRFMSPEQQKLMDKLYFEIVSLRDALLEVPNVISRHPIFAEMSDIVVSTYHKALWALRYYELIPRGWETLFRMYSDLTYLIGTKAEVSSSHFDSPNYVLFAPEQRKVELVQSLPFPWKTLLQPPQFGQMEELQTLYQLWKTTQSAESDMSLPTFVPPFFLWWNDVAKRLDVDRWLPPFTAHAMLAGHQHLVTFDERVIDFAGPCSYLLTRDFLDGNFSVAVNYMRDGLGRPIKRSLTIWLDDREVEIASNFQVIVDSKKVELPQSFGHTEIYRETNRLTLSHAYGFSVSCHVAYDVCTFTVSGWYTGRLGGLLGTYDYEAGDDIALPNGQSSSEDLAAWGKAWTLDSCHTTSNLAVIPPHKDPVVDEKCKNLFNSSRSMFSHCYQEVDPISYLHMCLSDVQTDDTPEDICTSAAAYVKRCISHKIPVRIPKLCVRCPLPSGTVLVEGDAKVIRSSTATKKADVVFIVEAKKCNRDLPKVFADFVASVDSSLDRAGVVQRRFSTVVFGGSGIQDEPHIHTVDSQIFVSQRLISGLHNFLIGRGHSSVFDAFRFASKLPFEPGASKTFVLVACSIGDDIEMKMDYPEVHWLLLEDGITLHLLLDKEFDVKKPEVFYGIDGSKAFTAKDARSRELKGDSDLRRQVTPPKDLHVPIALEVNGTVFSSLRLFGTKQVSKRFLDVFSRRLAQSAAMDVCHNCECFPDDVGVGRLYCHPCVFPKPVHVYAGTDYGFDDGDSSVHRFEATDGEEELEIEEEEGIEEEDRSYDMDYDSRKVSTESSAPDHDDDANRSKQLTKFRKFKEQESNHKRSGRKQAKAA